MGVCDLPSLIYMCTTVNYTVYDNKRMVYLCGRSCLPLLRCVCKLEWGVVDNEMGA